MHLYPKCQIPSAKTPVKANKTNVHWGIPKVSRWRPGCHYKVMNVTLTEITSLDWGDYLPARHYSKNRCPWEIHTNSELVQVPVSWSMCWLPMGIGSYFYPTTLFNCTSDIPQDLTRGFQFPMESPLEPVGDSQKLQPPFSSPTLHWSWDKWMLIDWSQGKVDAVISTSARSDKSYSRHHVSPKYWWLLY